MPLKRALVMVLLFALGCLGPVAPLAAQEAATVSGPLPGTWLVGGFGASGQSWKAFLEIKAETSGRFMWRSDRGETGKQPFDGIAYGPRQCEPGLVAPPVGGRILQSETWIWPPGGLDRATFA